jgi:precorrin-2 dehydrogenase / sirohydrochlorin ferrochelatase
LIPIHLDPACLRVGLIGNGALALRRLDWLRALDCEPQVWSPSPEPTFSDKAGPGLIRRLPDKSEIEALNIVWISDLDEPTGQSLAALARANKVIVNVEDVLDLCDFHTPALVRRGQLLVSAGTGGASPAAAAFVRRLLEAVFPPAWSEVLADLSALRQNMRKQGAQSAGVIAAAKLHLADEKTASSIAPCGQASCPLLMKATQSPTTAL